MSQKKWQSILQSIAHTKNVTSGLCHLSEKQCKPLKLPRTGQRGIADNTDGAGVHKVLQGGTMNYPHRSIYPATVLDEVEKSEWNEFSRKAWQEVNERSRAGWIKIDPDGYPEHEKRMEALREAFEKSKNQPFISREQGAKLRKERRGDD